MKIGGEQLEASKQKVEKQREIAEKMNLRKRFRDKPSIEIVEPREERKAPELAATQEHF